MNKFNLIIKRNTTGALQIYRIKKNGYVDRSCKPIFDKCNTSIKEIIEIDSVLDSISVVIFAHPCGLYKSKMVKKQLILGVNNFVKLDQEK